MSDTVAYLKQKISQQFDHQWDPAQLSLLCKTTHQMLDNPHLIDSLEKDVTELIAIPY